MLSLDYFALSLLILTILTGTLQSVTATLSYRYSKAAVYDDYFFWYRQYPGKPPEFLISHLPSGEVMKKEISGLISSAAVSDSAVYYCAVRLAGDSKLPISVNGCVSLCVTLP
uniref:Immunoglobulin V-set domain-containing protein n=1 Tax=Maylandia zebra TaxID=106582 RepID=A0A3P9D8N7_9CICH